MGLFNSIFGKSIEGYEDLGDKYIQDNVWGQAKIEYESALQLLKKKSPYKTRDIKRLQEKITNSSEALALSHKKDGEEMVESGAFEEARDIFGLALELTQDSNLKAELKSLIDKTKEIYSLENQDDIIEPNLIFEEEGNQTFRVDEDDYFLALCGTLPVEIQREYKGYGSSFRQGYVALNNGDFEQAASLLEEAIQERSEPDTFIPFELSTAHINLGNQARATELLEQFLSYHPDSLPAYQSLCEIYWEKGEFENSEQLIDSSPDDVSESVGVFLLRGETLFRQGEYTKAKDLYSGVIEGFGWSEPIARELAKVFEALNEKENALKIYSRIMNDCSSCGSRTDPYIKKKYLELNLTLDNFTTKELEICLSLIQEDPQNASIYYNYASQISERLGNTEDAERFGQIAEKY